MSDFSKFLKRAFGVPEINLSQMPEVRQITGTLSNEGASALVKALDDASFEALRLQVAIRYAKQSGRAQ